MSNVDTYEIFGSSRRQHHENNDCTVIALAAAAKIPYHAAHAMFKKFCSRRPNNGVAWNFVGRLDKILPINMEPMEFKCRGKQHNITLNQFCKRYPKGRFYVLVAGHALAIVDGVIHDHSYKPRRHVIKAYRILS